MVRPRSLRSPLARPLTRARPSLPRRRGRTCGRHSGSRTVPRGCRSSGAFSSPSASSPSASDRTCVIHLSDTCARALIRVSWLPNSSSGTSLLPSGTRPLPALASSRPQSRRGTRPPTRSRAAPLQPWILDLQSLCTPLELQNTGGRGHRACGLRGAERGGAGFTLGIEECRTAAGHRMKRMRPVSTGDGTLNGGSPRAAAAWKQGRRSAPVPWRRSGL